MADLGITPAEDLIRRRLDENIESMRALPDISVTRTAEAAAVIVDSLRNGGKVMFCGNGGSSMDAGHLAGELLGRFYRDRRPLAAVSLADGTAALTAIANDYAYEDVFSRQVRGMGRAGDVLVCLTTSGNSPNVVQAIEAARQLGVTTVAFTGRGGGTVSGIADICIAVASTDTPRVQEACIHLGHTMCELVEVSMCTPDAD